MIKPYVITQAQVKTYLGITDTTYDTQIDLYLPVVTDDLTRKNGICNQSFLYDTTCTADTTDTLTDVVLSSYEWDRLYEGASILVDGNENSILSFDEDAQEITLASATVATGSELELLIRNFPVGALSTVAKMIFFKIEGTSTDTSGSRETTSESIGPVSVSYADISGNGGYDNFGYPESLTKSLKTIRRMRFY